MINETINELLKVDETPITARLWVGGIIGCGLFLLFVWTAQFLIIGLGV